MAAFYARAVSPISIDGETIDFVEEAEHVNILRWLLSNFAPNLPNLAPFLD